MVENSTVNSQQKQEFSINRIYLKDISYESPNTPSIFNNEWKPDYQININVNRTELPENLFEVVLDISIVVKLHSKTAFIVEIKTAGLFIMNGFSGDALDYMLKSFCPNILFPYVREYISEATVKGGFPPLYIAPVNFDAMYQDSKSKESGQNRANDTNKDKTMEKEEKKYA